MRKLPDDFPHVDEQALPSPAKPEQPTDDERRAFTARRLEMQSFIMRDFASEMTPTVKMVGLHLLECVNSETLRCFPSYRTILETLSLGKNEKTVQRAIEVLRNRGWLYSWRPDRKKSNHFVFLKNEAVVSQILDYQDAKRARREEDRLEREEYERTQMSVRELPERTQMSVRERTPMSGKSFNIIPEPISSIEQGASLIGANDYESVKVGDDDIQPFDVPQTDEEAEKLLDEVFAWAEKPSNPVQRRALKSILVEGKLTPWLAKTVVAGPERVAA